MIVAFSDVVNGTDAGLWSLCEFESTNSAALEELITKHKVKLVRFPEDMMNALRKMSETVLEALKAWLLRRKTTTACTA